MSDSLLVGVVFGVVGFTLLVAQVAAQDFSDYMQSVISDVLATLSHDTDFFPDHIHNHNEHTKEQR